MSFQKQNSFYVPIRHKVDNVGILVAHWSHLVVGLGRICSKFWAWGWDQKITFAVL